MKLFGYLSFIQIRINHVASDEQNFIASFQTDIKDNTMATTDAWVEFSAEIPQAKEFTVCHWINIKFHNSENAACLWSYCTVESPGRNMGCLQACLHAAYHTLNRNLLFERAIKLSNRDKHNSKKIELNNFRHRTWTHLCWSFSAITGESKYYHGGNVTGNYFPHFHLH